MKIEVNAIQKDVKPEINLKELVELILTDTQGLAVAINDNVIPKTQWQNTKLFENDKVLFIKATQGG